VYKGSLSANLSNFVNWNKMPGLRTAFYNTITLFDGKLYTNFSKFMTNGNSNADTLFVYDIGTDGWSLFHPGVAETVLLLREKNNQLIIVYDEKVETSSGGIYSNYLNDFVKPKSATLDNAGKIWIADAKYGLVTFDPSSGYSTHYPNGPASEKIFSMAISESNLWVAPGGKGNYFIDGMYYYSDGEWKNPRGDYPGLLNLDTIADFMSVVIDPLNSKHVFAASWGRGIVEFLDGIPVKLHDKTNTNGGIQGINYAPDYDPVWLDGMAFDASNNLWITTSGVTTSMGLKKNDGTWQSIDFAYLGNHAPVQQLGKIIVDKNDQKWFIITKFGEGLVVYKAGTTATANSSNTKKLTTAVGNGALPSLTIFDLAEDKEGEIWIGTDKGIAVFYSPENVFTGQNFDAQQILIEQDGHIQILLETEAIQAIAVDDANRKWIGTAKSGVFLLSPDGGKEIFHFETDNSPLLSNNVKNITIDRLSGEVYFGTDKGIISYRGTSVLGNECFEDVYSFPNPVKPGYSGPIAIKGLVENTTVKITDISGSLVYETKSEGGQAIWDGNNFKGERVSSGVYMVFCTSENTSCQKIATKILLVN
jgi:sugar lactone lactonase YvrE